MATRDYYIIDETDREPKRPGEDHPIRTLTANTTLTIEDGGQTFFVATNAVTITLPAVGADTAPEGMTLAFINTGADGNNNIILSPAAGDAIYGTIANATADSVASGTDGQDWTNTQATANRGDRCKIKSDGVNGWYIISGVGIWVSS